MNSDTVYFLSVLENDNNYRGIVANNSEMLRRLGAPVARKMTATSQQNELVVAQRNIEPMSSWYLASWVMIWEYQVFFWFPMIATDFILPSFMYNKLPMIHFIQEKKAELKLRRALDETYTKWSTELDSSAITDAVARTF